MLTNQEKRTLFRDGRYKCAKPFGDTATWPVVRWVEWIDANGEWEV